MLSVTADGSRLGGAGPVPPLTPPPRDATVRRYGLKDLRELRSAVTACAQRAGLDRSRTEGLALAVTELATNSIVHADGGGTMRTWLEDGALVCEMRDGGAMIGALEGMRRPGVEASSGRGLWLVKQLCDLVQVRSLPTGNTVRVSMEL